MADFTLHGPGNDNGLNTQNLKLKKLKLHQLGCVYSEEAMAPFKANRDGFTAYLRGAADPETKELCSSLLNDLLILPLSVALYEPSSGDTETPSRYIPLDMVHLIPILQEYAPDIVLSCVLHRGLSMSQIQEEQNRRSMLHSGYYKQITAGFPKQLEGCRPGLFIKKQLATLIGVSESAFYKYKPPVKKPAANQASGLSSDLPTDNPLTDLTDISEF